MDMNNTKIRFFILLSTFLFTFSNVLPQTYFIKLIQKNTVSAEDFKNLIENKLSKKNLIFEIKEVKKLNFRKNFAQIFVVKFEKDKTSSEVFANLKDAPEFAYVEKSKTYEIEFTPNDELYSSQWGLEQINIESAWEHTIGDTSIIIGLIDTGVDFAHPDLQRKFKLNAGEIGLDDNGNDKRYNQIDDDNNGYVDDYVGWNFLTSDDFPNGNNNPSDDQGHGTFVAGIIGASTNNSIGVAGVNPNARVFVAKAFDSDGYGKEEDVAAAMLYLANNGARIINMSFGDYTYSQTMRDVIDYVTSLGVVLVGSAGNSSSSSPHYPSSFENVISVGANTQGEDLASFSNYGNSLDLLAPGVSIISTGMGCEYVSASGTSASAPFVTGVVSLILSLQSDLALDDVKQILKTTAKDIYDVGYDIYSGAGILDAAKAVSATFYSTVKFDFPVQDEYFSQGEIPVAITVLSPYFQSVKLFLGKGENPDFWEQIYFTERQIINDTIFVLNADELQDTIYTLRLSMSQIDGGVSENSINFGVDKTPPIPLWYDGYLAYVDGKQTFYSNTYTNEFTKAAFLLGESEIFLDNTSHNIGDNRFLHSGYFPPEYIAPQTIYDFDVVYTNKAGLNSHLSEFFHDMLIFQTSPEQDEIVLNKYQNFSIKGDSYSQAIELNGNKYLAINEFSNLTELKFYRLQGDTALATEPDFTISNRRIPAYFGEINNSSNKYLVSYLYPNLYIDKWNSTSGAFENVLISADFKNLLFAGNICGNFTIISSEQNLVKFTELEDNFELIQKQVTIPREITNGDLSYKIVSQNAVVIESESPQNKAEIFLIDNLGNLLRLDRVYNGNISCDYSFVDYYSTYAPSEKAMLALGASGNLEVLMFGDAEYYPQPTWFYLKFILDDSIENIYSKAIISNQLINNFNAYLLTGKIDNDIYDEILCGNEIYIFKNDELVKYSVANNFDFPLRSMYFNIENGQFPLLDNSDIININSISQQTTPNLIQAYSLDSNIVYLNFTNSLNNVLVYKKIGSEFTFYKNESGNICVDSSATVGDNYYLLSYDGINFSDTIKVFAHSKTKLLSVAQLNEKNLRLTFSNKIKRNLPLAASEIFNLLNENINATTAVFSGDFSYDVTFSNNLPSNKQLTLCVNNLIDFYNSPCSDDTLTFLTSDYSQNNDKFYVVSFKFLSDYSVRLSFNIPFEQSSALNMENYSVNPENHVTKIDIVDNKSLKLYFNNPIGANGFNYILTVKNLKSSAEYGSIDIEKGSGSQIALTNLKSSLKDAYVFPNPVNLNKNNFLTFANLTKNIRIYIYDINSNFVNVIDNSDTKGAIRWNIKNLKNKKISSGIYIYLIESLDNNGNIIESKTGKFAVVK